jgi:aspartate aminotransferase-like enzyme
MIHHRSPEFSLALATVIEHMRLLFGTDGDVVPVHGTGRAAMEAAVCSLFSPGDELVACCNGKFGEMWAKLAESYGLVVHRVCEDWARRIDPDEVGSALQKHSRSRGVTFVHCDSSTGVRNDVEAVCRVARSYDALAMVDAICAVGGMPFHFDRWDVDVAVTASQKCLMSSAGLSFAAVGERAWKAAEQATLPANYLSLFAVREVLAGPSPETPGSTPVHLVLQVGEALRLIVEEGLENVHARHEKMAGLVRNRIPALGLSLQCPELCTFATTLTAISAPEGVAPSAIRDAMRSRGILIARGLGSYEPTAFRIGHLGDIRPADVHRTLDALEEVLNEVRSRRHVWVSR